MAVDDAEKQCLLHVEDRAAVKVTKIEGGYYLILQHGD